MYTFLNTISEYKLLIVPCGAWLVAQGIKFFLVFLRDRKPDFSTLVSMGGMPSSHSATVCALATAIAISEGFTSPLFAIAFFFAIIVMHDAAGVRQTVSTQSTILNRMLDELFKGMPAFEQRVKEFIGHTRLQMFAGGLLGILLALWWM